MPVRAVALQTSPSTFPKWHSDDFPLLSPDAEFKFLIRRRTGAVDWEGFAGNRHWPGGIGAGGRLVCHFGSPAVAVTDWGDIRAMHAGFVPVEKMVSFRRLTCGRIVVEDMPPCEPAVGSTAPVPVSIDDSPPAARPAPGLAANAAEIARKVSAEKGKRLADLGPSHVASIFGNRGKVQEYYDTEGKSLGAGHSGSVRVATALRTGQRRAIKTIHRLKVEDMSRFKAEIDIMKMMDHPNVIKLYEYFEDTKNFYLVMELCTGGDLFDHIIYTRDYSETHAAYVMDQILKGINYIHHRQVAHRDIKPENFLLATRKPIENNTIKIIDFGLSHRCSPGQVLTSRLGTPTYVAPEVLRGAYGISADMWSAGVLMYVLLCGQPPFDGSTDQHVFRSIKRGLLSFEGVVWDKVSDDAKDFIRQMICLSPSARTTAADALTNHWLRSRLEASKVFEEPPSRVALGQELLDNLRTYKAQNLLKKATLQIIAWRFLDDERLRTMEEAFKYLDENDDGVLSVAEIRAGLQLSGVQDMPHDLHQIVDALDTEGNGTINYTAFLAATMARRAAVLDDVLQAAFHVFDKNGDGMISQEELQEVLGPAGPLSERFGSDNESAARIAEIIRQADKNGDGQIDFQEFVSMMRRDSSLSDEHECCTSSTEAEST